MVAPKQFRVVRDPIWNTIRIDAVAMRIIDTPPFQRLRYIRQLGHAHLVYPGATHTRFDHALGVYHLAKRALRLMEERGAIPAEARAGVDLIPYAALLHDIGHYAFSHAIEELESTSRPGNHEAVSARFFASEELAAALASLGPDAPARIYALIQGRSGHPLGGLVSGSLDLDKMEYLRRDARFCGVPYGEVDVDRLIQGLAVLEGPEGRGLEVGVEEKAVSALESLLFAKYQMFRNVYWHHGVRAATALYKRVVETAVAGGLLDLEELVGPADEELLFRIRERARAGERGEASEREALLRWLDALQERRLPKRAVEVSAADMGGETLAAWVTGDLSRVRGVEDAWAQQLGLQSGDVFIDFPEKAAMFQSAALVRRAGGEVVRIGSQGIPGLIDLPVVAQELARSARVLRVFCMERRQLDSDWVLERLRED